MVGFIQTPSRLIFTAAIIGSLALSACATKQDRRGPPPDREGQGPARTAGTFVKPVGLLFAGMDLNNDAIVTEAEFNAGVAAEWSNFDRNPSGTYFAVWSVAKLGSTDAYPTFMMFDKNFNNVVSDDEFSERLESEFSQMDVNRDGQLSRSEMIVAFAAPRGRSKPEGREGGGKREGGGGRPPR